jgi:hypothetical protein
MHFMQQIINEPAEPESSVRAAITFSIKCAVHHAGYNK